MKTKLIRFAALAAVATGMVFAQAAKPQARAGAGPGMRLQRLVRTLDLTADQKAQARELLKSSAQTARPLAQQLREVRRQLRQDAMSGATQDVIEKDSAAIGPLTAQLTAIRTGTFSKFYSLLTPEQKTKVEEMGQRRRGRRG